ncbi:hypothetical protein M3204_13990 [Mesobacillus subterraneus]|uniref:hypothetical protein n=1 Tax=Mesobacillus subterraneus TaxID=285983 RepID=UPI00203E8C79|nr:hypothetical protein [Mesobacillus subterraneus]MCM3665524.1 hypothetical protein [Mesobacillus subterraneus]MCM3686083.1 hypothetical protein [Mesobacillus subterraneus]
MKLFIKESFKMMLEAVYLVFILIASVLWIVFLALLVLVPSVFITIGIIYGAVKLSAYLFT